MPPSLPHGLYEHVVTDALDRLIRDTHEARTRRLDPVDSHDVLAQFLAKPIRAALAQVAESEPDKEAKVRRQVALSNALLDVLRAHSQAVAADGSVAASATELLAVPEPGSIRRVPVRPHAPLRSSSLLVNGRGEPSIGQELPLEIDSADEVMLLCAFLKWSGVRIVIDALRGFRERGGRVRIITTTYCGATETRALDALVGIGAEIRVSYETQSTRLHAKAWMFSRDSGLSTAYIGSSNLSHSALVDGLEWNVRLAQAETPAMIDRFRLAFEALWEDEHVERYDRDRFMAALAAQQQAAAGDDDLPLPRVDVAPYPFQRAILDRLEAERVRHGRWRNLIVAATGTGKTFIAGFDYARLRGHERMGHDPSLLFVAHRNEILKQSAAVFRLTTRDSAFGELYVGGKRPEAGRHVFASVQSLAHVDLASIDPSRFDVVVIDEFHHAAAATYVRLLEHFKPKVLLGLTATPERTDGRDIRTWFDGRMAAEIRLWKALEDQLLAPFHYFGLNDETDLTGVAWRTNGYDVSELEVLYLHDEVRVVRILQQVTRLVSDPRRMRALGFCISRAHARFMAARFTGRGVLSVAIDADSSAEERQQAITRLARGEIRCIFSVDVFNEGVDIPPVDTILMLRPTESATVFIQQLGRGLRHAPGKSVCTVLDFIGNHRKEFRFAPRFTSMLGVTRKGLQEGIDKGFATLPPGVHFELDRVARERVLDNLRESLGGRFADLVADLRAAGPDADLGRFLDETGRELTEVFRPTRPGWTALRRAAGFDDATPTEDEKKLCKAITRLVHVDDPRRVAFYLELLGRNRPPVPAELSPCEQRMVAMLHLGLWDDRVIPLEEGLRRLWAAPAARLDLRALLALHEERSDRLTSAARELGESIPLEVHGVYSRSEVLAAIGRSTPEKPYQPREGVLYMQTLESDFFFVTLHKAEDRFSPSTRYHDYAISRTLFHWETQSIQRPETQTVQRYIHHRQRGNSVFLFVRETAKTEVGTTSPFVFLGAVDYVGHKGSQPVGITWRLRAPMPEEMLQASVAAVG